MRIRTYSELIQRETFEERYDYLKLWGSVGAATFGYDRYLNQRFYTSKEWRDIRHHVIVRDNGCDLAVEGYEIFDKIIIHHMNPMQVDDLVHGNDDILNPEYLISTTHRTHNAIHFSDERLLFKKPVVRHPGDTKLW